MFLNHSKIKHLTILQFQMTSAVLLTILLVGVIIYRPQFEMAARHIWVIVLGISLDVYSW